MAPFISWYDNKPAEEPMEEKSEFRFIRRPNDPGPAIVDGLWDGPAGPATRPLLKLETGELIQIRDLPGGTRVEVTGFLVLKGGRVAAVKTEDNESGYMRVTDLHY